MEIEKSWIWRTFGHVGLTLFVASCSEPSEAERVEIPVSVDRSGITRVTTDLGYIIDTSEVRVVIRDFQFTIAGETHGASALRWLAELVERRAYAHPGHYQGGEVTGELLGGFVVDFLSNDASPIGVATLLAGTYTAANFTFGRGDAGVLAAGDPLIGHTAVLAGTASREGASIAFTLVVDSPEDRQLVGVPFAATIGSGASGTIRAQFDTLDPYEGDTVYDGLDFEALDADGDGVVRIEPEVVATEDAYNEFRRVFQTHDHYSMYLEE